MNEVQRLKQAMAETGASQELAARLCGVSPRTVHRWLKGENNPSLVYRDLIRKAIRKLKVMDNDSRKEKSR